MVFSLSSRRERERKTFFSDHNQAGDHLLMDQLITQTRKIAEASGVDVVWIDESRQRGDAFAERFTNAFSDVMAMGYGKVISIGNDCPELTVSTLQRAVSTLQSHPVVLGPATDGGVYLIGVHKSVFNASEFKKLPWLQDSLFDAICQELVGLDIPFRCLQTLSDLDDTEDLIRLVGRKPLSRISRIIRKLLARTRRVVVDFTTSFYILHPSYHFSLRAPPPSPLIFSSARSGR